MEHRDDGGPAFPVGENGGHNASYPGMSLWDWFTGQAIAGAIAAYAHPQAPGWPSPESVAVYAKSIADATLAGRAKL